MPELPEIETILRDAAPKLRGRHILSVEILQRRIARYSEADLEQVLPGRTIIELNRHGKFLISRLDRGFLTIHLGMTGQLLFDGPRSRHTRAVITLDDATLLYNDSRMFGSIEWSEQQGRVAALGPDALDVTAFPPDALKRRAPIKALLLNQAVFSGVGNIYADEALHRAGIHPRRAANRLSRPRAARLMAAIREVLLEAIAFRGSSISDYLDAGGQTGSFQNRHRVYGREGLPCPVCGAAIRRIVIAQRGTHYCPSCQR